MASQTNSAGSQFVLVKKQIGLFLERWLERHALKTIFKNLKKGDLVTMALEDDELDAWDEALVNAELVKALNSFIGSNLIVNPDKVELERQRLIDELKKSPERFTNVDKLVDYIEYEVAIDITNESVDKGVIAQNLMQALSAAPEYRASIMPQLFDIMGLTFAPPSQQQMQQQAQQAQGQPQQPGAQPQSPPPQAPSQSPMLNQMRANTMQTAGRRR